MGHCQPASREPPSGTMDYDARLLIGDAAGELAADAGCDAYHVTTPSSLKKPPFGPSSGRVARRTPIATPCSGVRRP